MVCNSGVSLSPLVDGDVHHFANRGLYNGLFLMADRETGSYWDHITGECVHGPLKGYQLEHLPYPLLEMTAEQALEAHPHAGAAISKPPLRYRIMSKFMDFFNRRGPSFLPPRFRGTMGEEDPRRPRMDMGLGVWTDDVQRYYPKERLEKEDNAVLDELDGRRILVYVDPASKVPAAIYTDATGYRWEGDEIHLDTGERVRNEVVYDAQGEKRPAERPMQMFTRWYGFAFTFPGCEIYGEDEIGGSR